MSNSISTPFSVQDYRCNRLVSVGRSGDLFAAIHKRTQVPYAIRRLSDEVLEDPEMAETVLHNVQRLVGLSHPNIVTIHEVLRPADGAIYVVSELIEGVDLGTLFKQTRKQKQPLPSQLSTYISLQICHALDQAHHQTTQGVLDPLVHGALWPPNVLLSFTGGVHITDFGAWVIPAAMQRDGGSASIRTQFSYRSPEHVNGDTLSAATDIFCVGVLLYEMLTSRQLFLGASLLETLELVETAQIGSLDDMHPALANVLERCLAQETAARYADVSGLISALSVAVPGAGTRAVREELARILRPLAPKVEPKSPAPEPLAPEPLDEPEDGAQPLRPLPGLGHQDDEPTHINPDEVNEALAALSKDATDPGDPDALDDVVTTTEDDYEDEEPTRIDPIIPGITGPLPVHAAHSGELDREGPTNVMSPADQEVLFSTADVETVPIPGIGHGLEHDDATEPNGSQVLPFPKRTDPAAHIGEVTEETTQPQPMPAGGVKPARRPNEPTTEKTAYPEHAQEDDDDLDDEPTAPTSPEMIKSLLPLPGGKAIPTPGPDFGAAGDDVSDEEPTVPHDEDAEEEESTSPTTPQGDPSATDGGIGDEDEPTVQARPRPGMTLLGVGKESQAPVLTPDAPRQLGRAPGGPPRHAPAPQQPQVPPLAAAAPPGGGPQRPPAPSTPPTPLGGATGPAGPFSGQPDQQQQLGYAPTLSAPAVQGGPGQPAGTLPPQPGAPGQAGASDAPQSPGLPLGPGENAQLTFSPAELSESGYYPDGPSAEFSTFDQEGSVLSVSFDKPVRRFTAAHLLLLVAIIVFIVAVGLLARRLLSSGRGSSSVELVVDAGAPGPTPDAGAMKTKTKTKTKGPRSKPLPAAKKPRKGGGKATVRSSGKNFRSLLRNGKGGRPGVIKISSTPTGIVYLDRRRKGNTPITSVGKPGSKLSVTIVAKGHQIYRKAVTIPTDRALVIDAKLDQGYYPRATGRRKGWLSIRCSRRRRWRIALNNKDTGFVCPVAFMLEPGRYRVSFFSLFGDKVRKRRVRITWGRRTRIWGPRR